MRAVGLVLRVVLGATVGGLVGFVASLVVFFVVGPVLGGSLEVAGGAWLVTLAAGPVVGVVLAVR